MTVSQVLDDIEKDIRQMVRDGTTRVAISELKDYVSRLREALGDQE